LTGRTDWVAIERLYAALTSITDSVVIAINHAVAIGEAAGPEAGLVRLDALSGDARVLEYQPYWAARAELLARAGQAETAGAAYQRAIGLASDDAVRMFLQVRLDRLGVYH
jgi:RNA polymerase sigma-70 factor (ECF subfamily)